MSFNTGNFSVATAPATADYPISGHSYVILPSLAGQAGRSVVMPAAPSPGQALVIENANADSSGFNWSPAGADITDWAGNIVSPLINQTVYYLVWNGTSWKVINS